MKNESKIIRLSIYSLSALFLLVSFIYPLVSVVINVQWSGFIELITQQLFKESLRNSIIVSTTATLITIIIAYFLAYAINRTNIKHKKLLTTIFTLPMLIPSISHGLGIINLFGNNGLLTNLFNINFNIMGINGIILGSVLYSFPIAFLLLSDAFKYVDTDLYESAEVLGLNKWQVFKSVTLYYMKKPILSAVFAIFTMVFTDYGVPMAIGGRFSTLPIYLYREVIGLLDFSKGAIIGTILLLPAFISFIFDLFNKEVHNESSYNKEFKIKDNKIRDNIFRIIIIMGIVFLGLLFGSFIYMSFIHNYPYEMSFSLVHFKYIIDNNVFRFLANSLLISIFASLFGTIFAYLTAYVTARIKGKLSGFFHIFSLCSLAIPGIVLGLSYIFAFRYSFVYNSFCILILVNIVHFFASPYLMAYNALGKLNQNFESVGLTCGVSRIRIILDVIIPNSKETILEMISYYFVNSMITISAVSFLFNTKTMPISLLINQYEGQLMYEESAIISVLILIINLLFKAIIININKRIKKAHSLGK